MDIRPIRTDEDHAAALREIEHLWDAPYGSPKNDRMDVLATSVADYESRRWPLRPMSPQDVLAFAITEMGRSQADLSRVRKRGTRFSEKLFAKTKN